MSRLVPLPIWETLQVGDIIRVTNYLALPDMIDNIVLDINGNKATCSTPNSMDNFILNTIKMEDLLKSEMPHGLIVTYHRRVEEDSILYSLGRS